MVLSTHIITCSLTPAKIKEFKSMKVVRPEWLTDSASAGALLPWQDYIFKPVERVENSQGVPIKQQTFTPGPNSSLHRLGSVFNHPGHAIDASTTNVPANETDPLSLTKSLAGSDTRNIMSYASATSNPNAQVAMANPDWRKAHTSIAPDFIEGYYKNSRLHHLSTWKSELRALVMEAQEKVESGMSSTPEALREPAFDNISMRGARLSMRNSPKKWKGKSKAGFDNHNERVIMHCDFDCFFVSAGLVSRPELKGKPVVVCHSQGVQGGTLSTSEIASCSYEAREFGIRNGMRYDCSLPRSHWHSLVDISLQQARKLCPHVITIPYEFEK